MWIICRFFFVEPFPNSVTTQYTSSVRYLHHSTQVLRTAQFTGVQTAPSDLNGCIQVSLESGLDVGQASWRPQPVPHPPLNVLGKTWVLAWQRLPGYQEIVLLQELCQDWMASMVKFQLDPDLFLVVGRMGLGMEALSPCYPLPQPCLPQPASCSTWNVE